MIAPKGGNEECDATEGVEWEFQSELYNVDWLTGPDRRAGTGALEGSERPANTSAATPEDVARVTGAGKWDAAGTSLVIAGAGTVPEAPATGNWEVPRAMVVATTGAGLFIRDADIG